MTYGEIINTPGIEIRDESLWDGFTAFRTYSLFFRGLELGYVCFTFSGGVLHLQNVVTKNQSQFHCATTLILYIYGELRGMGVDIIEGTLSAERDNNCNGWIRSIPMYCHLADHIRNVFQANYTFRLFRSGGEEFKLCGDIHSVAGQFLQDCYYSGGYFHLIHV